MVLDAMGMRGGDPWRRCAGRSVPSPPHLWDREGQQREGHVAQEVSGG